MLRPWLALLVLCGGCASDPCDGVDGTCVSLTVAGSGSVDGLVISLSGAATGTRAAPATATVSALPVSVALEIAHPKPGPLHISVSGVLLGTVVGRGATDVTLDQHATATVVLDPSLVDGGVSSNLDLECPPGGTRCGDACCAAGMLCNGTTCSFASAELYLYLCNDFNSGCAVNSFSLDGMCLPLKTATPGSCYATGFQVSPGKTYSIAACSSCNTTCSAPVGFTTPATLTSATYFSGTEFFCKSQCQGPPTCP